MTVCHSGRFCNGQPQGGILTGAHGVAPAGHEALGASGGTAGGQGHGLHVLVEGGGLAQLDQHDVVVDVVGAVVGVADDAGGFDELLISLSHSDVVLAHANLNTAERQGLQCINYYHEHNGILSLLLLLIYDDFCEPFIVIVLYLIIT